MTVPLYVALSKHSETDLHMNQFNGFGVQVNVYRVLQHLAWQAAARPKEAESETWEARRTALTHTGPDRWQARIVFRSIK